ncbi:metal ABC transporter substrate-binding protein [Brevibacillus marinus]|uniref:metal ABC transporter substrate-binding protein n=1 Tax=Brevibacillus marinus TaxID=2496837 RepID=UPI000F82E9B6|nr:metal ABC transporter substrate-binding protein [Brevibacillus marinus]
MGRWGRKGPIWLVIVALLTLTAACGKQETESGTAQQPPEAGQAEAALSVYTTIYPLQYAAARIGGEYARVVNIVPPGVEPHDFEPTAKDMVALSNARVFLYNGSGFELWVDKAVEGIDPARTLVVNATEGLPLLPAPEAEEHHADEADADHADEADADHAAEAHAEEAAHEEADEHAHGPLDPHVWLDPLLFQQQAEKIKDALSEADPAHRDAYERNYQALAADLQKLDQEYREVADKAKRKEFVVSHSAFGYLAHRYGLTQTAIAGLSPSDEPSPAQLKELVEYVKQHQIEVILFETLASQKVVEVIARETGAKTAMLHPLEGLTEAEQQAGKDYLTVMRENLETLRLALGVDEE